jgi:hypothetical protein
MSSKKHLWSQLYIATNWLLFHHSRPTSVFKDAVLTAFYWNICENYRNDRVERVWNEATPASLSYYPRIPTNADSKTTKIVGEFSARAKLKHAAFRIQSRSISYELPCSEQKTEIISRKQKMWHIHRNSCPALNSIPFPGLTMRRALPPRPFTPLPNVN